MSTLIVDAGMPKLFHVCLLNEYREVRVLDSVGGYAQLRVGVVNCNKVS